MKAECGYCGKVTWIDEEYPFECEHCGFRSDPDPSDEDEGD